MQSNKLNDLSPSLQYAINLTELDASNNYLTSLPPTLDKLTQLTKYFCFFFLSILIFYTD